MPVFSSQLGKVEKLDEQDALKSIANHIRKIQEELEYRLANLDSENITSLDASQTQISTAGGNLNQVLKDVAGNISLLERTADGLSSLVSDNTGAISALQQTAVGISSVVSAQGESISSLQQTASSLTSSISSINGDISSLQQTASSLSSSISSINGSISTLQQTVNGFSLSVSNGTSSSTIKLMSGSTVISSKSISFSGMVTFSDLSKNGRTTINGSNITTGTINACNINGVNVTGCTIKGSRYYNKGGTTWMEVGKDLNGVDNDVYALYVANSTYSNTGVFGIYNGDSGFVTLNGKGFNFLLSDAIEKTVRINVGTGGKYWEFSTTGIKFCNANGTVTNWVRLVNE